jgi:hypothetical protein
VTKNDRDVARFFGAAHQFGQLKSISCPAFAHPEWPANSWLKSKASLAAGRLKIVRLPGG